jgi:hypothetical protein
MQTIKNFFSSKSFTLILVAGIVYLIFIPQIGYFNDDWYLMYAAGARGAEVFNDIFIVDRPMRAFVMSPAYVFFQNNPIFYNVSALSFRVLSAAIFYWCLSALWKNQKTVAWLGALLYLIYPGFLSQFNGIDYQSQMVSLALMMLSLALTIIAYQNKKINLQIFLFLLTTFVTTFYLGLVEYFIGMEVLKVAALTMLVYRDQKIWISRIKKTLLWGFYSGFTTLPFLIWRLFFFESQRGATDVDFKLGGILSDPLGFLSNWLTNLLTDSIEVTFFAYFQPLQRLSAGIASQQWIIGLLITTVILLIIWFTLKDKENVDEIQTKPSWRIEAIWLGIVMLIFGLLPVILVGRDVDFKSFSRYSLAPSIGVVLLWQAGLGYLSIPRVRNVLLAILISVSALTHYINGLVRVNETQATSNFWWQVSWRIPQLGTGTTLITHYAVAAEEDYFTWGPANLIYHPESDHEKYVQPAIYAMLLNEETIEKVLAREPQEYSERRSIRTYPNARNILILTQPTPFSCVQVIDSRQEELSSYEDERVKEIASFSEADQIALDNSFQTPPMIPFGEEPEHDWCYYYQKASYARQAGDWEQVSDLGEAVFNQGYFAEDQIEWMPFFQAYAYDGNISRLQEISSMMAEDVAAIQQACQILSTMQIEVSIKSQVDHLFCIE